MALSKSLSILDRHTFLPGDVIFREGEMGDCAFIINQGLVEITKKSGRRSVVLDRVGVQGIFGEMAMIDAKPRSATATALEPTQCLVIKNKVLRQKIDKADPFLRALLRIMVRNLRSTNWLAAGPGG